MTDDDDTDDPGGGLGERHRDSQLVRGARGRQLRQDRGQHARPIRDQLVRSVQGQAHQHTGQRQGEAGDRGVLGAVDPESGDSAGDDHDGDQPQKHTGTDGADRDSGRVGLGAAAGEAEDAGLGDATGGGPGGVGGSKDGVRGVQSQYLHGQKGSLTQRVSHHRYSQQFGLRTFPPGPGPHNVGDEMPELVASSDEDSDESDDDENEDVAATDSDGLELEEHAQQTGGVQQISCDVAAVVVSDVEASDEDYVDESVELEEEVLVHISRRRSVRDFFLDVGNSVVENVAREGYPGDVVDEPREGELDVSHQQEGDGQDTVLAPQVAANSGTHQVDHVSDVVEDTGADAGGALQVEEEGTGTPPPPPLPAGTELPTWRNYIPHWCLH